MINITTCISIGAGILLLLIFSISNSLNGIRCLRLINESNDITRKRINIFSYMPFVGYTIGPFVFGFIADFLGRKYSIAATTFPLVLAFGIFELTNNFTMWCIANVLDGLSFAGLFMVFIIYIGEIAEKSSRGKLICIPFIILYLGHIIRQIIFFDTSSRVTESIVNYFCIVLSLLSGILFAIFAMETPSFYVKKGMDNAANSTLAQISKRSEKFELEFKDLRGNSGNNIEDNREPGERIMPFLKSNGLLKAAVMMLAMSLFQLLSGTAYHEMYSTSILLYEGSLNNTSIGYVMSVPHVVILGLGAILVDIIGRKLCLMISFGVTAICLMLFAVLSTLSSREIMNVHILILATLMVLATVSFIFGGAHIPTIFMVELFPLKKRMLASAVFTAISFDLRILYFYVISFGGMTFWLYVNVFFCAVATIVVKIFYLETKGKSLNQIQLILNRW